MEGVVSCSHNKLKGPTSGSKIVPHRFHTFVFHPGLETKQTKKNKKQRTRVISILATQSKGG